MKSLKWMMARVKVDPESGCWLWTGAEHGAGYGNIKLSKERSCLAHRMMYEILRGPIPDGLELDHLCRVKRCVNPDHLEAVTHRENVRRGDAGKRFSDLTHCKNGHEFTPENTYWRPQGNGRGCKICRAASGRRFQRRNVERCREWCREYYNKKKALRIA